MLRVAVLCMYVVRTQLSLEESNKGLKGVSYCLYLLLILLSSLKSFKVPPSRAFHHFISLKLVKSNNVSLFLGHTFLLAPAINRRANLHRSPLAPLRIWGCRGGCAYRVPSLISLLQRHPWTQL